jgi:tRNA A37 threonylcarbamoyladenosine modification protein TsaB
MNLFIDSISSPCYLALFDWNRVIQATHILDIKWNESSKLIPELDIFLNKYSIQYSDLENIVTVNGPGSFTWVRTTVLIANSLNYVIKKHMTPLSYFDLFEEYPIIKSSSKRDCFVKKSEWENIEIISNIDVEDYFLKNNITECSGDSQYKFSNTSILDNIDYSYIIKTIEFQKLSQIDPLYIKKPNIS